MPWRPMVLRGQRVLARCRESGDLVTEQGRVEIRYRRDSDKSYRAASRSLEPVAGAELFPDDHCVAAEAAQSKKASKGKGKPKKAAVPVDSASFPRTPRDGVALAYADGACSGNPGPSGLGVVLLVDGQRRELSEFLGVGTNNTAELTAILRTAEALPAGGRLDLYTDSSYAIGVVTGRMKAKKNRELIQRVQAAVRRLEEVSFHYVPGHAGVDLNERADGLAVEAVKTRESTGWTEVIPATGER